MTIKLVNQYSIDRARNYVRGSLQAHGEQCILLSMYHPSDNPIPAPCPNCADDVYDGGSNNCMICYGTGFLGGIKTARRVWGLFSDHKRTEKFTEQGSWAADAREIQTEAFPELLEHDYVVRVRQWDLNNIPIELEGFYIVGEVTADSLRTGGRFGQFRWDVVGQRASITKQPASVAIAQFPVLGQNFTDVVISPQVLSYDTLIGDGINTTFTVTHGLNTEDIAISVFNTVTEEEVKPNVGTIDANNVHVAFGFVPNTNQFRVIVVGTAIPSTPVVPIVQPDTRVVYLPQTLKYVALLGDGQNYLFPINHKLGTKDVTVSVFNTATDELVDADVKLVDADSISVGFDTDIDPPAVDSYRCVIRG